MSITYSITDDIYKLTGYYGCNYDEWKLIAEKIKSNIKYGDALFECGYMVNDYLFFVAMDNDEFIGVLKFKVGGNDSYRNPGFKNWICFISVHKDYRNKGIGTVLREMLFKYCSENGLNILSSGFTLLGYMYNLKGYIKLAEKYGVEYCYEDGICHPDFNDFEGLDEKTYMSYYKKHRCGWDPKIIIINKKEKNIKNKMSCM